MFITQAVLRRYLRSVTSQLAPSPLLLCPFSGSRSSAVRGPPRRGVCGHSGRNRHLRTRNRSLEEKSQMENQPLVVFYPWRQTSRHFGLFFSKWASWDKVCISLYYYIWVRVLVSPSLVSVGKVLSGTQFSFRLKCWYICLLWRGERFRPLWSESPYVLVKQHLQLFTHVLLSSSLPFGLEDNHPRCYKADETRVKHPQNAHYIQVPPLGSVNLLPAAQKFLELL